MPWANAVLPLAASRHKPTSAQCRRFISPPFCSVDQRDQTPFTAAALEARPERHGDGRRLTAPCREHVASPNAGGGRVSGDGDVGDGPTWRHRPALTPQRFESFALIGWHPRVDTPRQREITAGERPRVGLDDGREFGGPIDRWPRDRGRRGMGGG